MKTLDKIQIGERILRQRLRLGWTRAQLAERIGLSVNSLRSIETGAKGISMETLTKLSNQLKLTADYILYGESGEHAELEPIIEMLRACPKDKLPAVSQLLRVYLTFLD